MNSEVEKLEGDNAKVTSEIIQKYLVWRRSVLVISVLPVMVGAIMGLVGTSDNFKDPFNGLGILLNFLVAIDGCLLFAAVVADLWFWHVQQKTIKLLGILWAISVVSPLVPALFPLDYVVTGDFKDLVTQEDLFLLKSQFALSYAVTLLPIIITFPSGASRGAKRIRGLFPSCTLAGWILMMSAPFYSIFILLALVVIIQLAGNALLLIGTLMLTVSP